MMSRAILDAPTRRPSAASRIGDTVREIGSVVPSLRRRTVSKCSTDSRGDNPPKHLVFFAEPLVGNDDCD